MRNGFEDVHVCAVGFFRKVYADIDYTFDSVEYIGEQECQFRYSRKDHLGAAVHISAGYGDRMGTVDALGSRFVYDTSYGIQDTFSSTTHYFISNIRIILSVI
jgi:hypothetical protein